MEDQLKALQARIDALEGKKQHDPARDVRQKEIAKAIKNFTDQINKDSKK